MKPLEKETPNSQRSCPGSISTVNSFEGNTVEHELSPRIFMVDSSNAKTFNKAQYERYSKTVFKSKSSKFIDEEFPPNLSSLVYVPKKLPDKPFSSIIWARLHELFASPSLYSNEDLSCLKDHYWVNPSLINSLFAVSQVDGLVRRIFGSQESIRQGLYYVKVSIFYLL